MSNFANTTSFSFRQKLFQVFFVFLMFVCVLDPSDTILHLKTPFLFLSILFGCLLYLNELNFEALLIASIWVFALPVFYVTIGAFFQSNYSFSNAIDSWKPYTLFLLMPFLVSQKKSFFKDYLFISLFLIVVTGIIYSFFAAGEIPLLETFIGDYENTMKIAIRPYGDLTLLMIYHNSISILLFGFAFSLYMSNKSRWFKILAFLAFVVLILSATRANMLASFFILIFHWYQKYFIKNAKSKIIFLSVFTLIFILLSPLLISTFFSSDEQSLNEKTGFINDYVLLWKYNPELLLFGQGMGGGILTSLRGLSYNLETTYFEIVRIYGIVGGIIFFLLLLYPVFIYYKYISKFEPGLYYRYMIFVYLIYLFLIIPSNPLLFSSTGFLIILLFYSEVLKVKLIQRDV